MRAGTRTELGHKWAPMGHRPLAPVRIGYEFVYLYLTLCPFSGQGYAAFLPRLDKVSFGWFIDQIRQKLAGPALLIADGAKAHQPYFCSDEALKLAKLPPYCPELNPIERFFREVRRRLKNKVFQTLDQAQRQVQKVVEELADEVVSVTCFPYIKSTSKHY
jgi:transposase